MFKFNDEQVDELFANNGKNVDLIVCALIRRGYIMVSGLSPEQYVAKNFASPVRKRAAMRAIRLMLKAD